MTWSAGSTAITPVVERAPTSAAPSVTAAHVSRPIGSATTLSFGSLGNCFRTSATCAVLVMMKMFLAGTSGSTRSTASCKKDFLPSRASSCLGIFSRLNGQKRSPRPPAMMMTKRFFRSVLVFMLLFCQRVRVKLTTWKSLWQARGERFSNNLPVVSQNRKVELTCPTTSFNNRTVFSINFRFGWQHSANLTTH